MELCHLDLELGRCNNEVAALAYRVTIILRFHYICV